MDVKVDNQNGFTIFSISGKLDASTAGQLENQFNQALNTDASRFIVSMESLNYVSSAGLRVILSFAKQLHAQKKQLRLASLQGSVKSVFEISGFYALFPVFETVQDAMNDE